MLSKPIQDPQILPAPLTQTLYLGSPKWHSLICGTDKNEFP